MFSAIATELYHVGGSDVLAKGSEDVLAKGSEDVLAGREDDLGATRWFRAFAKSEEQSIYPKAVKMFLLAGKLTLVCGSGRFTRDGKHKRVVSIGT